MTNLWAADVELSQGAAVRLLEDQFPELRPAALVPLGSGWDNDAYVVNGAFVFRFPRRKMGAELIAFELRALPVVKGRVPLPVPDPRFVGVPAGGYPYPFAGYPLLPGQTADRVALFDDDRVRMAPVLGGFLRALHDLPVPAGVPGDLIGRADLTGREARFEEKLAGASAQPAPGVGAASVLAKVRELSRAAPHRGPPLLLHGDLYARHLLVDENKRPCGVIDWGDVHAGDPAIDLSLAYGFLPPAARPTFFARYGDVDDDTHARARLRALWSGACLVDYGSREDDEAIREAGARALFFAMS